MMEDRSQAELEALSAYLDGELPEKQRIRLEARLLEDDGLQAALDRLRWTRALLRNTPRLIRKRSFTLTPEMAAAHRRPAGLFPAVRMVSALATILFVVLVGGDLVINRLQPGRGETAQMDSMAAAPEAMEMDAADDAAMPVAAAEMAEGAVEEPAEESEADTQLYEESTPTEISADADLDGDGIPDEVDDDDSGDQAEEFAPPWGTQPPPVGFPQGGDPEQEQTPGIGGGGDLPTDAPTETATETPTTVPTQTPTATAEMIDEEDIQPEEAERAMLPPQEGEDEAQFLGESGMEEPIEPQKPNWLLLCLRISEILLAVIAVGAGVWAWRMRRA